MSKRGRASKGEEEEESHVSFAVNEDREEDVDASESMDMREMETQKLDVDGGDEEEESEAALSGGYGQLTNDEENDHQQQYIADEEDDIDVDALMEGADSSPTGSIPVVSFLNDEEEADLESRAQAESLIHEPAASPPNEKLKKIAIKRAMQRTTRAPSSFIVYSTKRRAELDSSMSFKDKAQLISQEYKTLDETQKAELDAKCALDKIAYEQRLAVAVDEEMSLLKEDSFAAGGGPIIKDIQFRDLRHSTGITLPLAKVKRIIKGNPEVKNISKEGATFITKATEVFLSYIALKGMSTSALRGGKSIQEKDFIHMVHSTPMCEFLKDDFPRRQGEDGGKSRPKPKQGEQGASLEDKLKASKENRMANAAAGTGKLSSFFGSGSGSGSGGGGGSSISANAELVGGSASKNKNKKKGSPSASVSATVASKSSPARAMSASERFFSTSVSVSELESAPASASQSMGGLDIREQETMHMSMSMEDEE